MPSDQDNLEVVLRQKQDELSRNVAAEESRNLKNSLLFQFNWPELIQSAPTAISSMGACFVAATSDKASVTLKRPEKGFEYLRYESLQANLVETANLGRYAFNEAQTGMGMISQASDIIDGKLKGVLQSILDPETAKVMLKPQMSAIKQSAQSCSETAKRMEKSFNDWLYYACEMHAACVEQERSTTDQLVTQEISKAVEQCKLDLQKDSVATAKQATDLLGKQVETSSEAFKKASDEFPSGWDIVGQQIVGELAGAATTALKAMMPALVMAVNPVAGGISQGGSILGSLTGGGGNNANGANNTSGTGSNAPKGAVQDSALRPTVDQAAVSLQKDMTYIELLSAVVNGPSGNIDWEKASAKDAANVKSSIGFIANMLADAKSRFAKLGSTTETSQKIKTILDTTAQVSAGIVQVVKDNQSASSSWPAASDPKVKGWIDSFSKSYDDAQFISAKVSTNLGSPASSNIVSNTDPASGEGTDAKSAQGQAILKSAQNRLDITQKAYMASQENYLKASSNLLEQQNKLTEISGNLARLTASNITLAEIKKILIESIKLIIQLKNQINNLVQFFGAFTVIIGTILQLHVEPFLATVRLLVSGQDDPNANFKIGNFTLTDKINSELFGSVLTLRTYYSVFGDIAKMWMRISIESIQPGLRMCDELSMSSSDSRQIAGMLKKLNQWSDAASANVRKIVGDTQDQIKEGMETRVSNISDTMKLLPPAPARKAIEDAKNENTKAVAAALDEKKAMAPITKKAFQID